MFWAFPWAGPWEPRYIRHSHGLLGAQYSRALSLQKIRDNTVVSAALKELWVYKEGVGVGHEEFVERDLLAGSLGVGWVLPGWLKMATVWERPQKSSLLSQIGWPVDKIICVLLGTALKYVKHVVVSKKKSFSSWSHHRSMQRLFLLCLKQLCIHVRCSQETIELLISFQERQYVLQFFFFNFYLLK